MGVFVILLNKSGVRDFTRHGVSAAAKDGVGSLKVRRAQWIDVQRGALRRLGRFADLGRAATSRHRAKSPKFWNGDFFYF